MSHFQKPKQPGTSTPKRSPSNGVYTRDPATGESLLTAELKANQMVSPSSGHHFPIAAHERIRHLTDPGSFEEHDASIRATDPLQFVDSTPYATRLKRCEKESNLLEAAVCGCGKIHGLDVAIAVMDFRFCGGAMGAATGEKLTRTLERALARRIPCVIFCSSGGARMQEGIFSLMQMAKITAAIGRLAAARLPYISVLTHPTSGGVTASFATAADLILGEPGAFVGFAGPVVLGATIKTALPPGFQTSEFSFQHGLVDQIVPRTELRDRIHQFLLALHVRHTAPALATAEAG